MILFQRKVFVSVLCISSVFCMPAQVVGGGVVEKIKTFIQNNAARLYYATSMRGQGFHDRPVRIYLDAYFSKQAPDWKRVVFSKIDEKPKMGLPRFKDEWTTTYFFDDSQEDVIHVAVIGNERLFTVYEKKDENSNNKEYHSGIFCYPYNLNIDFGEIETHGKIDAALLSEDDESVMLRTITRESFFQYWGKFIGHLRKKFWEIPLEKNRPICLHTLLTNKHHTMYAALFLRQGYFPTMNVSVYDSMPSWTVGLTIPLVHGMLIRYDDGDVHKTLFFHRFAKAVDCILTCPVSYYHTGCQVMNHHDCSLFSLIALLNHTLGSKERMSALTIYAGLKELEKKNFSDATSNIESQDFYTAFGYKASLFSKVIGGFHRNIADFVFKRLEYPPFITPKKAKKEISL